MSDNHVYDANASADLDEGDVELEVYEEILEEWEDLGWFDLLPTGLAVITSEFGDVTLPRIDFDTVPIAELQERGLDLLEGDRLWAVMSEDMPEEERVENHQEAYADYLSSVQEQREMWSELAGRDPRFAVSTLSELVDLLVSLQLLHQNGELLELADPVPDPLEVLPLSPEATAKITLHQLTPEIEAVEDVLHGFLYHSEDEQLATTVGKLAEQAEVSVEIVRLTIGMLIADPDSGISADRFGPLDQEAIEGLAEHQKFTLRVDRGAAGLSDHEH